MNQINKKLAFFQDNIRRLEVHIEEKQNLLKLLDSPDLQINVSNFNAGKIFHKSTLRCFDNIINFLKAETKEELSKLEKQADDFLKHNIQDNE